MLRLYYKASTRSKTWKKSSLSRYPQATDQMVDDANTLAEQNDWAAFQIKCDDDNFNMTSYRK